MLLREKMKQADFSLIDLATFLQVSRPTAYKFIELFESNQKERLEAKILGLFDFIDKNENLSKIAIFQYIFTHIFTQHSQIASSIKTRFIEMITQSKIYDDYLEYLLECEKILKKTRKTKADLEYLKPLQDFEKSLAKLKGE